MKMLDKIIERIRPKGEASAIRHANNIPDFQIAVADKADTDDSNLSTTRQALQHLSIIVSGRAPRAGILGGRGGLLPTSDNTEHERSEVDALLGEVRETQDEIQEELVNIRKAYKLNRNIYERVLYRINALKREPKENITKPKETTGGGGGLLGSLAAMLLGGLGMMGPLILPMLTKLLGKAVTKIGKAVTGMMVKLGVKGVKAVWKVGKAVGRGVGKVGKATARLGGKALKAGGRVAVRGAKALGGVAKTVARGGGQVAGKVLGLGKNLGGAAIRQVGGLILRTGAMAVASPLAVPLLIAAAATAVGFGAYKLAKYFKLSEKLDAFIGKVSGGKYKSVADLLWGVAKGEVAKDLFTWVKNKIGTLFEDSIGWLKDKANAILGRFSPWANDTAEKREADKRKEDSASEPVKSTSSQSNHMPAPVVKADRDEAPGNDFVQQAVQGKTTPAESDNNNKSAYYVGNVRPFSNPGTGIDDKGAILNKASDITGFGRLNSTQALAKAQEAADKYGDDLKGATVFISTGIENDEKPNYSNVEKQIKIIKSKGATVYVSDPGDKVDYDTKTELIKRSKSSGAKVAWAADNVSKVDALPTNLESAPVNSTKQIKNASPMLQVAPSNMFQGSSSFAPTTATGTSNADFRAKNQVGGFQPAAQQNAGLAGSVESPQSELQSARSYDPVLLKMAAPHPTYV